MSELATTRPEHTPTAARVDAVVLAGGVNRIPLFPGSQPGSKALVEMHGRPLIAYVLDALRGAESVGRIYVVGPDEVQEYARRWEDVEGVPDGHQLIRNVMRGLRAARTERVLFCNPDQPLLRAEMVEDFVQRALERPDAHLVTSWVRCESLGRYVEGDHKFCDFGDGRFAHGNLFMALRDFPDLEGVRERFDRLYEARKSNVRFAWELGPALFGQFVWAKMVGHLPTLEQTLDIGGEHFGVKIVPAICLYPEIVLDIDEPEDYEAAERHLRDDLVGASALQAA